MPFGLPRYPARSMKALFLTKEYPPNVYGGAGFHVAELTRALRREIEIEVRSFGDQAVNEAGWQVRGYPPRPGPPAGDERLRPAWDAMERSLAMAADGTDADLVHCHTWYTHLGGSLIREACGIPLVITLHSLEPLRPWKREQLGGGYDLSSWVERNALEAADRVIAVSGETRRDVLRLYEVDPARVEVIHNGIDTDFFAPDPAVDQLIANGIDPASPYILFVGRITRQKGIGHLLDAIPQLAPDITVVLAAGQADTPELAAQVEEGVAGLRRDGRSVVWIPDMLSREAVRQLYSHATLFVCPSVYEPFGLINLEAMACGRPVVASAVGGIPEVVVHGETGLLVPLELSPAEPMTPTDPARFAADLAGAINALMADPARREAMGAAGRSRAVEQFSWESVAAQTLDVYRAAIAQRTMG